MANELKLAHDYIHAIEKELLAGNATEHTHRPALKALIALFNQNKPFLKIVILLVIL